MKSVIAIGCDHAGFELKEEILNKYNNSYDFLDLGCFSSESVDYPDFGRNNQIILMEYN